MIGHYQTMGVSPQAALDEIKRIYFWMALQNHFDKTILLGSAERAAREAHLKKASGAYEALSDPREASGLRRESLQAASCSAADRPERLRIQPGCVKPHEKRAQA